MAFGRMPPFRVTVRITPSASPKMKARIPLLTVISMVWLRLVKKRD